MSPCSTYGQSAPVHHSHRRHFWRSCGAVLAGLALGATVLIGTSAFTTSASSATAPASSASVTLSRHAQQVRHAHAVHVAKVHYAWALWHYRAVHPYLSWWTTKTPTWACIRVREEGGQPAPANMFGFVPFSGYMSDGQQRALALSILHSYGWGAWTTAPGCGA